ncbi:MAG: DNA polymerase III subunit beta, partial [Pseudomonadales bacterium]
LAMNHVELSQAVSGPESQVIVPRKGVIELQRLLSDSEEDVILALGASHLRLSVGAYQLTTKLVDGRFPD